MALSRVVSEIFNVEKYRDLEISVKGQSKSLKFVSFGRLNMVSYLCSTVTLSLRRTLFEIFAFLVYSDLKTQVMGHSRSSDMAPYIFSPITLVSTQRGCVRQLVETAMLIDGRATR